MKIRDYSLNQNSLMKSNKRKSNKIIKNLILSKSHHFIRLSKVNSISFQNPFKSLKTLTSINRKKKRDKEIEQLVDENKLFIQLYTKTKELYPTKVEETFRDLIFQNKNNEYKVPDLSDKKNIFSQNPLLLVGRDLELFYMFNDKNKNKIKKQKLNK